MKVLLLEGIHPIAQKKMTEEGYEVELLNTALEESVLIDKLADFQALGIRSKTQVTKKVLESCRHLHGIGTFCIGTNQVDLTTANALGIPVFNAPYSNTRSVAELVISEMIALSRQLFDRSMKAHQGHWEKSAQGSREVRGKTLGIIGYGHIGSQVSILAEALGLRVIFYDVVKKLPLGNSQSVGSLQKLLESSDFVTLHVPETSLTHNMMDAKKLNGMKKGAYLINASRGTVVDLEALKTHLESGHIAGAALDVYPIEPKKNGAKFSTSLQGVSNVILTPHIGGSTEEAQESIGVEVSESLQRFLTRGCTLGAVNFPQVDMPLYTQEVASQSQSDTASSDAHSSDSVLRDSASSDAHSSDFVLSDSASSDTQSLRLLNVHRNVPGVLSDINGIVSKLGINIQAQSLVTDSHIGYLLMDLQKSKASQLKAAIEELPVSVCTRIL